MNSEYSERPTGTLRNDTCPPTSVETQNPSLKMPMCSNPAVILDYGDPNGLEFITRRQEQSSLWIIQLPPC